METTNYYVHNQETQKLNIFTTKAYYNGLDEKQRKSISSYCLWSNQQQCWISKAKLPGCGSLKQSLNVLGLENRGDIGNKMSFAEQVQRETDRAAARAGNAERRAEKAQDNSKKLFERASEMISIIPPGQPIHVGHHSEQRDRNYRARIDNTYRRGIAESDKADCYREKAANAKWDAGGRKFANPDYVQKRIDKCEKQIRTCERHLKGQYYRGAPEREISEKARELYQGQIAEEKDKLDFFVKRMKEINPEWVPKSERKIKKGKGNKL